MKSGFNIYPIIWVILQWVSQAADNQQTYFGENADAMDYIPATNTFAFSTASYEIKFVDADTKAVTKTLTTNHIWKITCIKMSSDANLIFTGGTDFFFNIYDLTTDTSVCSGKELRGQIKAATIFDDFDRFAFVTNQGYIYYGNITICEIQFAKIQDHDFVAIQSVNAEDQIWVVDKTQDCIYEIVLPSFTVNIHTFSTSKVASIAKIPQTSYFGVCTQRGFYVIDYDGNIVYSYGSLNVLTFKCTFTKYAANQYLLTAISEQQIIRVQNNDQEYLWNIWKLVTSPSFDLIFIHEQENQGNRYGNGNVDQPLDAYTFQFAQKTILVGSIASGYNPYRNLYGQEGGGCGGNSIYNGGGGTCLFCFYDHTVREYCKECSNAPVCQQCYAFTYLSAAKICLACPTNCYKCQSNTKCTSCLGDYVLHSDDCIAHNITGCGTSYYDYGEDLPRCIQCQIGYYVSEGAHCHVCNIKYLNCLQCDNTKCTKCEPNYFMPDTTTGFCQICSKTNEGCSSCLNGTYCETCSDDYPYYSTISATQRVCIQQCYYKCETCNRDQFDQCTSCDSNSTLTGTDCVCNAPQFVVDPQTLACNSCQDYLSDCKQCSSTTFCDICDANFFFEDVSATNQTCKACNASCLTCDTYWYKCSSCSTAINFRELDTNTHQCICPPVLYFQLNGNIVCELCTDHLDDCETCYNETYCLKCESAFYIKIVSPGNHQCDLCTSPCKQCFGTDTNCTDCFDGRQLNKAQGKCECLYGYFPTSVTDCAACHTVLGSCQSCDNDTECLLCYPNTYFVMENGAKKCASCKKTCLTCDTWNHICASCDPLAHRVLNTSNQECQCETGYIETDDLCLDCSGTFEHCNNCDLSRCYSCDEGFSLAFEGLKCIECNKTYPGCILCINGLCAACDEGLGYQLSYSRCICAAGYYRKQLDCVPYKMGSVVRRAFPVYESFKQQMNNDKIQIKFYFQCFGIFMPYPFEESVKFSINNQTITNYEYSFDNTTLYISYQPERQMSLAEIKVEFKEKSLFDLDEYGPKRSKFTFNKNIFINSTYELSTNFGTVYYDSIIEPIRWMISIALVIGATDLFISLALVTHFLPAFLFLNLSIPLPLKNVLEQMAKINQKSLFIFSNIDLQFQSYEETEYIESYGIEKSIVDTKTTDLALLGSCLVFYGFLMPMLYLKFSHRLPNSGLKTMLQYKFIFKRYSTVASLIIFFIPSLLFSASLNFNMQEYNSSLLFSPGLSIFLISASGVFVIVHSMILLETRLIETYKNEQCYMGSSPIQSKSILFVLSTVLIIGWGIPMLALFQGIYCLPILILVILIQISCFRNWDNYPLKPLYFIKLFQSLLLVLYVGAFLVFQICEKFLPVSIQAIDVIGLTALVFIIILFSLSLLEALILLLQTFYRVFVGVCKKSNMIENENEDDFNEESDKTEQTLKQEMNIQITGPKNQKLTDKKAHMKNFREKHFRATASQRQF